MCFFSELCNLFISLYHDLPVPTLKISLINKMFWTKLNFKYIPRTEYGIEMRAVMNDEDKATMALFLDTSEQNPFEGPDLNYGCDYNGVRLYLSWWSNHYNWNKKLYLLLEETLNYTNEKKTFVTSMMAVFFGFVFAAHINMRTILIKFSNNFHIALQQEMLARMRR